MILGRMSETAARINSRRREVISAFFSSFDAGWFQWQSGLFLLLLRDRLPKS